jgi:hypothetical protein
MSIIRHGVYLQIKTSQKTIQNKKALCIQKASSIP